jgi:protease-4
MEDHLDDANKSVTPSLLKKRLIVGLLAMYAASLILGVVLFAQNHRSHEEARVPGSAADFLKLSGQDSVGIISIHGPIYSSDNSRPWDNQGLEQWERRLQKMSETRGIKAIILDINSPGGSVGAVQELYSQILRVRKEKHIPVIAFFGDIAASGGYYIASACDKIVAHPGTLTGSIGVIFDAVDAHGLLRKIGVKMSPIKSGKFKDIGSPARAMTAKERKLLQSIIDNTYEQFLAAVSSGRHISIAELRPLADGRIFSGEQAYKKHLVDQLGDSVDAIDLAAKLGGIKGKPRVRRGTGNLGQILEILESRFMGGGISASALFGSLSLPHAGLEYLWTGY